MTTWPDTLKVTRPGAGSTGSDDVFVPGAAATIYNDAADVQDDESVVESDGDGNPGSERRAVVYLKDETKLDLIEVDDDALATFADASTRAGSVVGSRKLDGKLLLKWVD